MSLLVCRAVLNLTFFLTSLFIFCHGSTMNAINAVVTFATLYVALLSFVIHLYQQSLALSSAAVDVDTKAALATAANEARGLAMDSIAAAHSGHMGLPLGAAEIGATLYGLEVSQFTQCCVPSIQWHSLLTRSLYFNR